MSERYAPEDPREWLNRARSNLVLARMQGEGVYLEDLCFNTQQAVEKAIKALLIQRHVQFPYVRYCRAADGARNDWSGNPASDQTGRKAHPVCSLYALPWYRAAIREEYTEALRVAGEVIRWVDNLLRCSPV